MTTLQEALNYRPRCLIHDLPMNPGRTHGRVRGVKLVGDDLEVRLRSSLAPRAIQTILFKADGTMTPSCELINDAEGLTIYMDCAQCFPVPLTEHKLVTTVNDILKRNLLHRYSFGLSSRGDRYSCTLLEETIKFHNDDRFYHLHSNPLDGNSSIQMGGCHSDTLLQQLLDSLMNLKIPQFNSANIKSIEQLVDKCKLYNLFS